MTLKFIKILTKKKAEEVWPPKNGQFRLNMFVINTNLKMTKNHFCIATHITKRVKATQIVCFVTYTEIFFTKMNFLIFLHNEPPYALMSVIIVLAPHQPQQVPASPRGISYIYTKPYGGRSAQKPPSQGMEELMVHSRLVLFRFWLTIGLMKI